MVIFAEANKVLFLWALLVEIVADACLPWPGPGQTGRSKNVARIMPQMLKSCAYLLG